MTTILRLDTSVSGAASVTARLNSRLVENLTSAHPTATVVQRDLTDLPLIDADRFAANNTPADERTAAQAATARIADELIAELEAADVIVVASPVYNFGVPSALKAWMDLVARAGRTFKYSETGPVGQLQHKKAFVVSASGGVDLGSPMDFATPHIKLFLGFLGITDVTLIDAGGLMTDPGKLERAEGQIDQLALAG